MPTLTTPLSSPPALPNVVESVTERAPNSARLRLWLPFVAFLLFFALTTVLSIQHKGLTFDEANHLNYGTQLAFGHAADRPINSVMPITALNALGMKIHPSLTGARAVTILFSLATATLIFAWTWELYGLAAAYLAGLLYLLCPSILAHSSLVTTDIYAAGTVLFALYAFRRLVNRTNPFNALLTGVTLGLALLAKYTSVALLPIFCIILAIRATGAVSRRRHASEQSASAVSARGMLRFAGAVLLVALTAVLVINAGNLFQRIFVPLADFHLQSHAFTSLLNVFPWLGKVPAPVSFAWLQGLDWVLHDSSAGAATPHLYLFGELRDPATQDPFTGYYFLVSLFKVPLPVQLILLLAAGTLLRQRDRHDWLRNELFLLVPLIFFFYFFNFSMRTQVGLRHFLVAFPPVFILAGSLLAATAGQQASRRRRGITAVLLLAQLVSVARFYPHFIPYVNELVTDRNRAYTLFADSNLSWGGDGYYLNKYLATHPKAVFQPPSPVAGTVVVELNALVGILHPESYRWLRDHFTPVDTIAGGSYLVYEVPDNAFAALPVTPEPEPEPEMRQ